jgi:hypothetical protein
MIQEQDCIVLTAGALFTPTALCIKAQGCEARRATLGRHMDMFFNPVRVVQSYSQI